MAKKRTGGNAENVDGRSSCRFRAKCCGIYLPIETLVLSTGRVYDPCCGSAGMFVQSEKF
jgi:type I restriction enzyme M protein